MMTHVSVLTSDAPASARRRIEDRLVALERFADSLVSVRASLRREAGEHGIELHASVGQGLVLSAEARDAELGHAIDRCVQRLARQLGDREQRRRGRRRRMRA